MKNIFNLFCFLLTTHLSAQNLSFEFRVVINQAHPLEESRKLKNSNRIQSAASCNLPHFFL
ncbi:MAG: hypothetical protein RL329_1288 [Bacteroidota bacterium]|jgi:hypothetical protein